MLEKLLRKMARQMGFKLVPFGHMPPDLERDDVETIRSVEPYTMTGPERLNTLIHAVKYVTRANIPGSIVECGVWRGGSMMAAANTLLRCGHTDRELYLFDTFEGMTAPSERDIGSDGSPAFIEYERTRRSDNGSDWCYASIDEVERNLLTTGYDARNIKLIQGRVEETIPAAAPSTIAILRLDTDWYESTRHELEYLYPRLSSGGILIVDDYGFWQGSRQATDEYLARHDIRVLLNRIDEAGRILIKP